MAELSLEEAYRKWSEDLGRYATVLVGPTDAADAVADAIVRVIRRDNWDAVRQPRAYLFTAVLNSARMLVRSSGRRKGRELSVAREATPEELGTDIEVWSQLDVLSVRQRAAVYLTYWEDLPVAQVAEVLGVGDGTVRRQLARARSKLRKVMSR